MNDKAHEKKSVSEVKAYLKGLHISPRKARLVAQVLKNLSVAEALTQLDFIQKKAVYPIKKLLNSAVASASHNFEIPAERLFIKSLTVDGGAVYFRYQPRAQGRALPVRKRTSHLNLILGVSDEKLKIKKQKPKIESEPKEAVATEPAATQETEKPKSRFAFWRKQKPRDTSQVAPKEDVKGKKYTGFDRRGNM